MPMLCAMSVLAALSALPFLVFLQPGYGQAVMPTLNRERISMYRSGSCCHFGHVEGMMPREPSSPGTGLGIVLGSPRPYSRHSGRAGLVLGFCLELGMAQ